MRYLIGIKSHGLRHVLDTIDEETVCGNSVKGLQLDLSDKGLVSCFACMKIFDTAKTAAALGADNAGASPGRLESLAR